MKENRICFDSQQGSRSCLRTALQDLMWQDGLKVLKFHSCLRLLAPSYIVTSGLVGLLLLLDSRWKFWNTKTSLVFVWVEQDFLPKWPTSPFMYHLYLPQITKGWSQMTLSKPAGEGGCCELLGPSNVSLWQKGDSCLWLLRFRFVFRIKFCHRNTISSGSFSVVAVAAVC